jgi:2,3-bisphosphoglycerate-independent phosphoglycerate mutase
MRFLSNIAPVVLVILDGWGYRQETDGNAIANAKTPVMTALQGAYPHTFIETSGKAVGLPAGQMGNSEVGHLTIGAGRMVPQELVRISEAIDSGTIAQNPVLHNIFTELKETGKALHLMGLCSDGGVHASVDHLFGLLKLAKSYGITEAYIHAFTDGRDTSPDSGIEHLALIEERIAQIGLGTIATVSGRYYAMDRDKRWERTEEAYRVLTEDHAEGEVRSSVEVLRRFYSEGLTDEFIPPSRVGPGVVKPGDGVIFFNFRPDRSRQLTHAFVQPDFVGFERTRIEPLHFVTLTQYEAGLPVHVAFKPISFDNILGQVISDNGLKQYRCAETEKYAHVTYFFNGGQEKPYPGEDRDMIPSPRVATYDQQPEMSAKVVTEHVVKAVQSGQYGLIVVNYANSDMVGHTGNYEATIKAIETVDACVGKVLEATVKQGGALLITADHGNSELMWDAEKRPWTAHTTNKVPFILVEGEGRKIPGSGADAKLRDDGRLADIAPTILHILGVPQPAEMDGHSLLVGADYEVRQNRTPVRVGL